MDRSARSATTADFVRHFAEYRRATKDGPVSVTNHGTATHVLLEADDYQQMLDRAKHGAGADEQTIADAVMIDLAAPSGECFAICSLDLECIYLNPGAAGMFGVPAEKCSGRDLFEAIPQLAGSVLEHQIRRTQHSRQAMHADLPSPFVEGNWIHLRSFIVRGRIVIGCRDITEEVIGHRQADMKNTLIQVMDLHGGVAYARLSLRGTIDRASETLAEIVGLQHDRLVGIGFMTLVDTSCRSQFRERLEGVLRGDERINQRVRLISQGATGREVHLAAMQLAGAYGPEGALILMTFDNEG